MINTDRIVPVTATDLLTLYKTIVDVGTGTATTAIAASDTDGDFNITALTGTGFLAEPAQSITIASTVTSGSFYFVPAYNYSGIVIGTATITPTGATLVPDGRTLYKATITSGAIALAQVTP